MELKLEVVIIPVSDVDRAKQFYEEVLGFRVDVDYRAAVYAAFALLFVTGTAWLLADQLKAAAKGP